MYTKAKTWDEMMKVVESLEPPSCLSVNYDPDEEEYKIWCGNQPYYFYQDEIEKLDHSPQVIVGGRLVASYDFKNICSSNTQLFSSLSAANDWLLKENSYA